MYYFLRADNKGEGGILALFSLVKNLKKKWLYIIAIIGAATLIADGVITPSLTVMAAIEGLEIYNPETPVVTITLIVLVAIFTIQQFGTSFIGKFFGPVMTIWFLMLGTLGVIHLFDYPQILKAFNPYYAVRLIINHLLLLLFLELFSCVQQELKLYIQTWTLWYQKYQS
jgi:KUP system potassium uptake protein